MNEHDSPPAPRNREAMTVCPCCGAEAARGASGPCASCGALAVGPPLPRPERELPSYGAALFAVACGALLLLVFTAATFAALLGRETFSLAGAVLVASAEQAAWRLKWTLLPAAVFASAASARVLAVMRREPSRFVGLGAARAGGAASLAVALSLALLVAVAIPERLRRRELARRAADNAVLYATDNALREYRALFGSYPAAPSDLRRLPRTDCSVEEVIARLESGTYEPRAEVASLAGGRGRKGRAVRARLARSADDVPRASVALTNYELILPGGDGRLGTADDLRVRDGLILDSAPAPVETKPTPLKKI